MRKHLTVVFGAAAAVILAAVAASAHSGLGLFHDTGVHQGALDSAASAARTESPEPSEKPEAPRAAEPTEKPEPARTAEPTEKPEPTEAPEPPENDEGGTSTSGGHDTGDNHWGSGRGD